MLLQRREAALKSTYTRQASYVPARPPLGPSRRLKNVLGISYDFLWAVIYLKKGTFQFGRFQLDVADHLLLHDKKPLPLPPKAFDTLLYLVENSRRLVTREELIKAVWPNSFVEDGTCRSTSLW
jgi:DNA-binding response OmpR family regulator